MNNEVKTYLADRYFGGRIPGNLVRYLYDQYGEDPLAGELSPQFFWPYVIGDVKAYINGTLDIQIRTPLQKLKERYNAGRYHLLFCKRESSPRKRECILTRFYPLHS